MCVLYQASLMTLLCDFRA